MTLKKKLRLLLVQRDLTQKILAHKAGIHPSVLSRILNETLLPNDRHKRRLAVALRVSVRELFGKGKRNGR